MRQWMLDTLESRRLRSVTPHISDSGVLTITGSDFSQAISVRLSPARTQLIVTDVQFTIKTEVTVPVTEFIALTVRGLGGQDRIEVSGDLKMPVKLYGDEHNDTIIGSVGADVLDGGNGDDVLDGFDGRDSLRGGNGNDVLRDSLFMTVDADLFYGGAGFDTVDYSNRSAGVTIRLDGSSLSGRAGEKDRVDADVEAAVGTEHRDMMFGSNVNNALYGRGGNDYIEGFGGNDSLHGGIGDDYLNGGSGADLLVGGAGSDTLIAKDGARTDTVWGAEQGVYYDANALNDYDVAFLDKGSPGDKAYATRKNNWS